MAAKKSDPRQLALDFEGMYRVPKPVTPAPGSLDYDQELREVIAAAIKATPKDRYQVAADMSRLTGQEITKWQIDTWTADSKDGHRFPFAFAAAFEQACGTTCLQELMAAKRGTTILVGEEVLEAKLGRIQLMEDELRRQKAQLKRHMGTKG